MIKINLAKRKQSSAVPSTSFGADFSRSLGITKINFDPRALEELPIRRMVIILITAIGANYLLTEHKNEELQKIDDQITKISAEQTRLKADLAKTKSYDALKKVLDADEILIRSKIETVQKLVADRQVPPKMLASLSAGIPKDVWLSNFKISDDLITIRGGSVGFGAISDFMTRLGESAYFSDVHLVNTQTAKEDAGADIAAFEIAGKRRKAN